MEYSINQLSKLSGVSARTLRYYDEIGLLKPLRVSQSGYRYYGPQEVDLLQQILFYRERGLPLNTILNILYNGHFNKLSALYEHLEELKTQKKRISNLIRTVTATIAATKGELPMIDKEKFEALKKQKIAENESQYGKELRQRYGEPTVKESDKKMLNMSQEDYQQFEALEQRIKEQLKNAVSTGEQPSGELGRGIAVMHKKWLMFTWSQYSKEAHLGIVDMYLADERFKAYYDSEVNGCAQFLQQAVYHWL